MDKIDNSDIQAQINCNTVKLARKLHINGNERQIKEKSVYILF